MSVLGQEQQQREETKRVKRAWFGEIVRARKEKGPGEFRLWLGAELKYTWPVITGGHIVEPKQYGGLTPPMDWLMVEPIAYREHPQGHKLEMARIVPVGWQKALYPKRTYDLERAPFMIHVAGRSSGCIAIAPEHWREAVRAINTAFSESSFVIGVYEEDL